MGPLFTLQFGYPQTKGELSPLSRIFRRHQHLPPGCQPWSPECSTNVLTSLYVLAGLFRTLPASLPLFDCPAPLQTHNRPHKRNVKYPQSSQGMSTGSSEGRHSPIASICAEARRTRRPKTPAATSSKGKPRGPGLVLEYSMPYPAGIEHIGPRRLNLLSLDKRPYAAGELHPWLDPEIENSATSPVPFPTDWQTPAGQSTLKTEDDASEHQILQSARCSPTVDTS